MKKIKIVTFNTRNPWFGDGINSFMHRAGFIYNEINYESPDIIAFQECMPKNMGLMEKMLPQYTFCGQYRNADYSGEGLFVAVKKDSWEILSFESFWLSPTPYVPGSRFPSQSDCPRICNAVQILHKESRKPMRIFNLHLDHVSEYARIEGIKCVLEKVEELNTRLNLPSVILGDFNSEPDSKVIAHMTKNAPDFCDVTGCIERTNHDFGRISPNTPSKIDYIYVTEELAKTCLGARIWDERHEGIYLSDHYPVSAEFEF